MSKSKRYFCNDCGEGYNFSKVPSFCPNCGSDRIELDNRKAKAHTKELIDRMNELVPQIESAWQTYVDLNVEFENMRRVLYDYSRRMRGIINKEDIPVVRKKKQLEALYEYRANRKDKQK